MKKKKKEEKVRIGPANNTGDPSHDDKAAWRSCFDRGLSAKSWWFLGGSWLLSTGTLQAYIQGYHLGSV